MEKIIFIVLAVLAGTFVARNRIATATGLSENTIVTTTLYVLFAIIFLAGIKSCSVGNSVSGSGTTGSSVGNGIWILLGGGLIVASVISRERIWLAGIFAGMAGLVFLALLGKFNGFFSWKVIGLPVFAAAGIWGATKTEGRTRSFLGFSSGIVILYWMYLFYQVHPIGNTGFIGTQFFANDTNKSIFVIFLAVFFFAIWKGGKIFYLISFLILLSLLGGTNGKDGMVDKIISRFPTKLIPAVSPEYKQTWKKTQHALLDKIDKALEDKPTPPAGPITKRSSQQAKQAKLVATVRASSNRFANAFPGGVTLCPGNYYQDPIGKTTYQFAGEARPRKIGNDGKSFTVLPGKRVIGALTTHRLVHIYQFPD